MIAAKLKTDPNPRPFGREEHGKRVDSDVPAPEPTQVAADLVDEASMESFPSSDPPGYTTAHS